MQLTLTLRGMLTAYLPPGTGRHTRPLVVADDATVDAVLTHLRLPRELVHLVMVNGMQLPEAQYATTPLHEHDTLAIWPPLSGG